MRTVPASLVHDFVEAAEASGDLARPALLMARLEYPRLDPAPYLDRLEQIGREAGARLADTCLEHDLTDRVGALSAFLYDELGFAGNEEHYEDPRNSFLNVVLDRRTGIPISLAVVYMEVARRIGLPVAGVNFPGHFLLRADDRGTGPLIVDPFGGGALLTEADCRQLFERHAGSDVAFDRSLLEPASRRQILVRMLGNLKRAYLMQQSYWHARAATDLLLALDPRSPGDLRDRGLLASHMDDVAAALTDLEAWLEMAPRPEGDDESQKEHAQIWEHVKTLRRRLASHN